MSKKLCERCRTNPAEIPDRARMGRPIKRICKACHAERIRGDLQAILSLYDKKKEPKP